MEARSEMPSKSLMLDVIKKNIGIVKLFLIMFSICIGILIAGIIAFYMNSQNSNEIMAGIFIKDINVSGMTKEEAKTKVEEQLAAKMAENIVLQYNNYDFNMPIEQIEGKFNIDDAVNYAYNIGKTGKFFTDVRDYMSISINNINIDPVFEYNEEYLNEYIQSIQEKLPDQLRQWSYYIDDDDDLIIENGTIGAGIYKDDLKDLIIDCIQDLSYTESVLKIPTFLEYPDAIDVSVIRNDIYKEAKSAYYTKNPYAVYPHVVGVDFSMSTEELQKIINENPREEYRVELKYTTPEVTIKQLGMDAFPNRISSFSTSYVNNPDRTTNLRLAANKINGTVLMPGETFSFNKVVGKRTKAAGYKNAAIFSDGQVVDGLGGGICQVTSTLYNAVIEADLEIVSRRNHMFVPSYVKAGADATVVWGSTDFKFKNSRNYPIKIVTAVQNGYATVQIYGLKNDVEYDISIESEKVKNINYKTVYQNSSTYKKGTVIQGGVNGSVVQSYKVYRLNGEVVKREKLYRDTYSAQNKIIAR